jgi:predicted peptidase
MKNSLRTMTVIFFLLILQAQAVYAGQWQTESVTTDYGQTSFKAPLLIYVPSQKPDRGYPLMIALHGWKLNAEEWKSSGIAEFAEKYSILVVCPQMTIANYEREYFPETVLKWNPMPSGPWIQEELYKYITSHFNISQDRKMVGVMGVSTGGHGAALLAGYYPETFGFAAMISGDYDVSLTPKDGLAKASFGPFEKFKARWKENSLVSYLDRLANTRLYIGHGSNDNIAPVDQSRLLNAELSKRAKKMRNMYTFTYHEQKGSGHNWDYWKTEVPLAMKYFVDGYQ